MQRTDVMLAWDDCVIRFKIRSATMIMGALKGQAPGIPSGWRFTGCSLVGKDPMAEFRVIGPPLHTAAAQVRKLLNDIESSN